jgi:transposase-like protein
LKLVYESLTCKLCGSQNIIRFGHYRGIQRWWCKDCRHKFADNDALPDMRMPTDQVALSVGMYYEGRSLNIIPRLMYQLQHSLVSHTSVKKWVNLFSKIGSDEADRCATSVGDTWLAYEKSVKIGGKNFWVIDIIDATTWFLLATKFSGGRSVEDIRSVLEVARDRAGKVPAQVLTDSWKGYPDGIDLAYGSDVKCVSMLPNGSQEEYLRFFESWQRTLKDRDKIINRLKNKEHAHLILNGWLVHYNYFRIQEALNGRTPGEAAKSNFKYQSWADLIYQSRTEAGVIKVQEPLTFINNNPKIRTGAAEVQKLKQLEDENRKLKQLVAELSLDKQLLQEKLRKNL